MIYSSRNNRASARMLVTIDPAGPDRHLNVAPAQLVDRWLNSVSQFPDSGAPNKKNRPTTRRKGTKTKAMTKCKFRTAAPSLKTKTRFDERGTPVLFRQTDCVGCWRYCKHQQITAELQQCPGSNCLCAQQSSVYPVLSQKWAAVCVCGGGGWEVRSCVCARVGVCLILCMFKVPW